MNPNEINFTWLVPCGPRTRADQLQVCLESILPQLKESDQLVLVRDNAEWAWKCEYRWRDKFGPMAASHMYGDHWPLNVEEHPQVTTVDAGLDCRDCGKALNAGLFRVMNPYVIRQDADDWDTGYMGKTRRQMHLEQILEHPGHDAWGFGMHSCQWLGHQSTNDMKCDRHPCMLNHPGDDKEKVDAALHKWECPVFHPATCFKLESLLKVGGWAEGCKRFEDYGLYCRMHLAGMTFHADPQPAIMHRRSEFSRVRADVDRCDMEKKSVLARMDLGVEPDQSGWRLRPFAWVKKQAYDPGVVQSMDPVAEGQARMLERRKAEDEALLASAWPAVEKNDEKIVKPKGRKRQRSSAVPSSVASSTGKTPDEPGSTSGTTPGVSP